MDLQQFNFKGHGVRVIADDPANPRWVAKDVSDVLGYSATSAMTRTLDADEKGVQNLHTLGGEQQLTVITEAGLYTAILGSKRPEAKEFKRWVTHEVLPAIRRHGAYLTPAKVEEVLTDPDTIIQLATNLKNERARRVELEAQAEADKPKVIFADAVSASNSTILVGELAKILRGNGIQVGGTRLFAWLRTKGFLINRKGTDWNTPTQKALELGIMRIKETTVVHSDGHTSITKTPKVTGKGQEYFVSRFLDGRFQIDEIA
ncbi:antirepressor (plasmid) [Corynebacterium falsenii DSM 44353]|uniref:phage antirepressor n=1 Tax=Corynebacterium falsenii TaxID=108486 RepID=UPI0003E94F51|nr:phage antirepressor KilAC domain-containing protein [Corynebacterium falsenii]AHI04452.1 antirepressor [Corynebacterium falsenii DSM 44353]UBI04614.1 phage antirepressor KilAC domain-containing protein [Corynebacterium falsenii]